MYRDDLKAFCGFLRNVDQKLFFCLNSGTMKNNHGTNSDSSAKDNEARTLRVLQVLELVSSSTQPVTPSQIGMRLQIPKATLARIVDILVESNHLMRLVGERGLIPGPRLAQLALQTIGNNAFKRTCRAVLRSLVQSLGETCNLTALEGDQVIHVERVETSEPLRLNIVPGSRHPLHCTAGGKLFLAQMNLLERRELLDRLILTKMTPQTITDRKALDRELDRLRERMVGEDKEEFVRGMVGVAVPVINPDKKIVAAVVCHTATARMGLPELIGFLPKMRVAANQLSELFISKGVT